MNSSEVRETMSPRVFPSPMLADISEGKDKTKEKLPSISQKRPSTTESPRKKRRVCIYNR